MPAGWGGFVAAQRRWRRRGTLADLEPPGPVRDGMAHGCAAVAALRSQLLPTGWCAADSVLLRAACCCGRIAAAAAATPRTCGRTLLHRCQSIVHSRRPAGTQWAGTGPGGRSRGRRAGCRPATRGGWCWAATAHRLRGGRAAARSAAAAPAGPGSAPRALAADADRRSRPPGQLGSREARRAGAIGR